MRRFGAWLVLFSVLAVNVGLSGQTIERTYRWSYAGREWAWTLSIPFETYRFFKSLPRVDDLSIYVTNRYDDQYLASLVRSIQEAAWKAKYSRWEMVNFVIAFVQSLPYTPDIVTTGYDDYPRYPLETIVDKGGDCEDTSILAAALLTQMGYDVVLLRFEGTAIAPGHVAVGIWSEPIPKGWYYTYAGRHYYYLETTGEGWQIGQMPSEYRHKTAHIIPLRPRPYLVISDVQIVPLRYVLQGGYYYAYYKIKVTVVNYGSATAWYTMCYVAFDAGEDYVWDRATSDPLTLEPLDRGMFTFYLFTPKGEWTRLVVQCRCSDCLSAEYRTAWFRP